MVKLLGAIKPLIPLGPLMEIQDKQDDETQWRLGTNVESHMTTESTTLPPRTIILHDEVYTVIS